MALNYDRLMVLSAIPTGAAGVVYTNTVGNTTYVGSIIVHNTNATSGTVTLYYVPATGGGAVGTAGTTTEFAKLAINANETILFEPKYPFVLTSTNDTIAALASISAINIICLGSTSN